MNKQGFHIIAALLLLAFALRFIVPVCHSYLAALTDAIEQQDGNAGDEKLPGTPVLDKTEIAHIPTSFSFTFSIITSPLNLSDAISYFLSARFYSVPTPPPWQFM